MPTPKSPDDFKDMDDPINVDMDPEDALRALLGVDPHSDPVEDE